jgi:pimeloyl-ACP methyl ester carboxylesterase
VLRYHEAGEGPPLLLLHGSGPGVTGWRNFRGNLGVFAEHILNAEFHTSPNCGHWVMIEQKAAFESVALAFLLR